MINIMNIAFAYNVKKSKPSVDLKKQTDLEFDSPQVTNTIQKTLISLGHQVYPVEANEKAFFTLSKLKGKVDLVFNIAEGLWGDARESQIPLFCEILKIPYTHASPTTHAISLNKQFTKWLLAGANVARVPTSFLIKGDAIKIPANFNFPAIIKPNNEGSSKGILDKYVINEAKTLLKRIYEIQKAGEKEILVEEFIDGREFTVSVLGNEKLEVLPIVEQKFDFLPKGMHHIASFELKWLYEDKLTDLTQAYDCPARLTPKLKEEIIDTTKKIYKALEVRDCARLDYRLNRAGELYFLEINTLPGINPDEKVISYFPLASRAGGYTFEKLIAKIVDLACQRWGI